MRIVCIRTYASKMKISIRFNGFPLEFFCVCASSALFLCLCRALLLGPLSYMRIGIYCVIKISDKKIFIFCIFIFIAMLKRFSILFIWTKCAHMCTHPPIWGENVHVNTKLVYENLCTDMFFSALSFTKWRESEKWVEIHTHTLARSQPNLSGIKWA